MTRNTFIGIGAVLAAALIGSSWQLASRHGVTTSLGPLELAVLRYGIPVIKYPAERSQRSCAT